VILVDSSIWIDHLSNSDPVMTDLLQSGRVVGHPFVTGEIALGNLRNPIAVIGTLRKLQQVTVADDEEVLALIRRNSIGGAGIGYVDAHLLAAARLGDGIRLWTRDKRLRAVAERLDLSANPLH